MSRKIIDIDLLSKEREDVFDLYYNKLEQLRLNLVKEEKTEEEKPNFGLIEIGLTLIERNLDDLASGETVNSQKVETGNTSVLNFLKDWFKIFEQLGERKKFIEDFSYNLVAAAALIPKIDQLEEIKYRKLLKFLSPSRRDKELFYQSLSKFSSRSVSISRGSSQGWTIIDTPGSSTVSELDEIKFPFIRLSELHEGEEEEGSSDEIPSELEDKLKRSGVVVVTTKGRSESFSVNKSQIEMNKDILALAIKERKKKNVFASLNYAHVEAVDIEEYRSIVNNSDIIDELKKLRENPEGTTYEWEFLIKIENKDDVYKANEIGYLIWAIAEGLEKIDGVELTLEDLGKGSRWFKIKAKINDELAKEEVKQVLNKTKEAAEAKYLDKPIEEAKKVKAEREKIEKEAKAMIDEEDAKNLQRLQIEKMELENEELRVKIMKDKLELINGVSQLITNGLIKNDSNIQIMINDLLFLEKQDGKLVEGEDVEIIEEDQIVNLPELDSPKEENIKEE